MIRVLHFADVHLGASHSAFGELAEQRRGEILAAFRRLPELARENEVHAVLIAGDLYDRREPPDHLRSEVRETLRRLSEVGPVFFVPGNHDGRSDILVASGDLVDRLFVLGSPSFEEACVETEGGPLHVHGFSYDWAADPNPLASYRRTDAEGLHVALLHGAVQDAPHWAGGHALRLSHEELAGLDVDYVALGDYHRFRSPEEFDPQGRVPACYPGSFAALDFTETGPHGVVVAELETGKPPRVTLLESGLGTVVDVGDVDVGGCETDEEVADKIARGVPKSALPVAVLGGVPDYDLDAERVRRSLEARFGTCRLEDHTLFHATAWIQDLAAQPTVKGHVARLGLERAREAGSEEERSLRQRALRLALHELDA